MVGRVAHTTTGVCIDLFAYGPVSKARPWQKDPRYSQITWWERKNDHAESGPERMTRWWQLKDLLFSPPPWGNDLYNLTLTHIFQLGWNHQLDEVSSYCVLFWGRCVQWKNCRFWTNSSKLECRVWICGFSLGWLPCKNLSRNPAQKKVLGLFPIFKTP